MEVQALKIHRQLSAKTLVQQALAKQEGALANNGALATQTGKRTGRSPKDRFIVKDEITENTVAWGAINQPLSPEIFNRLWDKALNYIKDKEIYVSDFTVGADPTHAVSVQVITELAWHHLFTQHLFIRSKTDCPENRRWTILSLPGLRTDPATDGTVSDGIVILNFSKRVVLLCGMRYAGEMKKAMFTVMNFLCPTEGVLPMHCSANVGKDGDTALFFGLSGTGKTTLSADPERFLIGDDEHGWSESSVFNFEGGCYAKCINLSQKNEPMIWDAIRDTAVMENVVLNTDGSPDYNDSSLTENTRAAYPLDFIQNRIVENKAGLPKCVIFLTCDLYGVLPPIALLTREQAAYYFLSGYTALVGSTEVGSGGGIKQTFSTCFGAPFFPRPATEYAELLMKRIDHAGCKVYLVNTGWTGGSYGKGGKRFSIPVTRAVIHAILDHKLDPNDMEIIPGFNLRVPKKLAGVEEKLLHPEKGFADKNEYQRVCNELISAFQTNFKKFDVAQKIRDAGPELFKIETYT